MESVRRTALRLGHILPVCSLIAPCPAGAGTVSVLARLSPRTAKVHGVPRIHEGSTHTVRQTRAVACQPEERTSVNQESHDDSSPPPKARGISSGSGSKKLSGTFRSGSVPIGRSWTGNFGMGRISAMGTLRRHRITISPRSTLSRYCDRWGLRLRNVGLDHG